MIEASDPRSLLVLVERAARGQFPLLDGKTTVLGRPPGRLLAVLGFTGHHVVAADVDPAWVAERIPEGDFLVPLSPWFLAELAARVKATPGSLDVFLAAEGRGGQTPLDLEEMEETEHPRVMRARRYRG